MTEALGEPPLEIGRQRLAGGDVSAHRRERAAVDRRRRAGGDEAGAGEEQRRLLGGDERRPSPAGVGRAGFRIGGGAAPRAGTSASCRARRRRTAWRPTGSGRPALMPSTDARVGRRRSPARLAWRCITPFGRPVVPELYSQNAGESAVGGRDRRLGRVVERRPRVRRARPMRRPRLVGADHDAARSSHRCVDDGRQVARAYSAETTTTPAPASATIAASVGGGEHGRQRDRHDAGAQAAEEPGDERGLVVRPPAPPARPRARRGRAARAGPATPRAARRRRSRRRPPQTTAATRPPSPASTWRSSSQAAALYVVHRRPSRLALSLHVLVVDRLGVDARGRRRDPAGHLARLVHADHQRLDVARGRRRSAASRSTSRVPLGVVDEPPVRADVVVARTSPTRAVEARRAAARSSMPDLGQRAVPAVDALLAVGDVVVAQRLVERGERRRPRARRSRRRSTVGTTRVASCSRWSSSRRSSWKRPFSPAAK